MSILSHPDEVVRRAAGIASAFHSGQTRWFTDEPYFNHVERVALSVNRSQEGRNSRLLVSAAVLHDTIEDTSLTLEEVRERFPELPGLPNTLNILTHREGDDYMIDYMSNVKLHKVARVIKRADLADNIATLPFTSTKLWDKYATAIRYLSS